MLNDQNTPIEPSNLLPFSHFRRLGSLLFVSGQASVDSSGKIVPDSFDGEMRRSIMNLEAVLLSAGSDLRHVIQTRNYVRCPDDLGLFNALSAEYFRKPYPARTTLTNCLPETLKYEIDCIAVIPTS